MLRHKTRGVFLGDGSVKLLRVKSTVFADGVLEHQVVGEETFSMFRHAFAASAP